MATNSSMEDVLTFPKPQQERRLRPQPDQALKCPRCDSTNTKFCYYNNYSLSQPRYFCKGCRRYWTQGGTLRNVPVGGGCRKNKRSSSSSKRSQDHQAVLISNNNSNPVIPTFTPLTYDSNDLTLAFARLHKQVQHPNTRQFGLDEHDNNSILGCLNTSQHCDVLANPNANNMNNTPFVDALRSGFLDTQSGFHHHNFNYGFGNEEVEGHGGGVDGHEGGGGGGELVMFPYHDQVMSGAAAATTTTATVSTTTKQEFCKGRNGEINRGFWNFPWHIGGGEGSIGGVDSGRESWNGIGSSWHGLINSPLM